MLQFRTYQAMLPAADLGESLSFYRDLGFRHRARDGGVAELSHRDMTFFLKAVPPATRFEAPIMIATVPSLRDWWIEVKLLDLGRYHRVKPPREPSAEPWGQTTGYLYDPSGTTWQFVQAPEASDRRRDPGFERAPPEPHAAVYYDAERRSFSIR